MQKVRFNLFIHWKGVKIRFSKGEASWGRFPFFRLSCFYIGGHDKHTQSCGNVLRWGPWDPCVSVCLCGWVRFWFFFFFMRALFGSRGGRSTKRHEYDMHMWWLNMGNYDG